MKSLLVSELLSTLTGEQALVILQRLACGGDAVATAIEDAARSYLETVDVDEVADDVLFSLEIIEVEDCWDRAGSDRYGYTPEYEAADELFEEAISSSVEQAQRYRGLQMPEQERYTLMGIILGVYRYEKESESEFKEYCVDTLQIAAESLLNDWRKRNSDTVASNELNEFIRNRCPDWSEALLDR